MSFSATPLGKYTRSPAAHNYAHPAGTPRRSPAAHTAHHVGTSPAAQTAHHAGTSPAAHTSMAYHAGTSPAAHTAHHAGTSPAAHMAQHAGTPWLQPGTFRSPVAQWDSPQQPLLPLGSGLQTPRSAITQLTGAATADARGQEHKFDPGRLPEGLREAMQGISPQQMAEIMPFIADDSSRDVTLPYTPGPGREFPEPRRRAPPRPRAHKAPWRRWDLRRPVQVKLKKPDVQPPQWHQYDKAVDAQLRPYGLHELLASEDHLNDDGGEDWELANMVDLWLQAQIYGWLPGDIVALVDDK
jgi:hypothetical protein